MTDPLEQVIVEIRGQLLVANANGYTLKDPELPASLDRHASFIVPKLQQLIEREKQAERQRLLELIGEDERRCQHYVTGEHNVFDGKRCHTSADQRNHLRAELRSALLSEEGSTNE